MTWSLKNDAVVDILVNGKDYGWIQESDDWQSWWTLLSQTDLNSGQNVIEFRNRANQNRTSSFTHWQLKDVKLWKPFNAKAIAGAKFLGSSRSVVRPRRSLSHAVQRRSDHSLRLRRGWSRPSIT